MTGITLKFIAVEMIRHCEVVLNKFDEIVYERNDLVSLEQMLQLIDTKKVGQLEWFTILGISDKLKERIRADDYNCEIEFSAKEGVFLEKLVEKVDDKMRKDVILGLDALRVWRSLKTQIDENNKKEETKE